jgi:Secretion system C-terminal sorting domain
MNHTLRTAFLLSFIWAFAAPLQAQSGCTDMQALNFSLTATQNDGSCLYPVTTYQPVLHTLLVDDLKEISGLCHTNGHWYGHNDSGADAEFYQINPDNGTVLKKIGLQGAMNIDWEDMCHDSSHLYFGDFGNNQNNRQNLGVYRVPTSAINTFPEQMIDAGAIQWLPFAYPDQTDFSPQPEDSTVYDGEAMFYLDGALHVFTKNWKHYQTTHYAISIETGQVTLVESFDVEGLITGASVSPDGKLIVLTGYNLRGIPSVFCWLLWDWQSSTHSYFSGNKRRIELGSALTIGQVEAFDFDGNRNGYIANERTEFNGFVLAAQALKRVDWSNWVPETMSTATFEPVQTLQIYPNPASDYIHWSHPEHTDTPACLQICNHTGQLVWQSSQAYNPVPLTSLPKGIYQFQILWHNGTKASARFVK